MDITATPNTPDVPAAPAAKKSYVKGLVLGGSVAALVGTITPITTVPFFGSLTLWGWPSEEGQVTAVLITVVAVLALLNAVGVIKRRLVLIPAIAAGVILLFATDMTNNIMSAASDCMGDADGGLAEALCSSFQPDLGLILLFGSAIALIVGAVLARREAPAAPAAPVAAAAPAAAPVAPEWTAAPAPAWRSADTVDTEPPTTV